MHVGKKQWLGKIKLLRYCSKANLRACMLQGRSQATLMPNIKMEGKKLNVPMVPQGSKSHLGEKKKNLIYHVFRADGVGKS